MAAGPRNDDIHKKLLFLQIPQWTVGLITITLGAKLFTYPLTPNGVSKDTKMFLAYAIFCGCWNVMVLPVTALLYTFPTPVKPSKDVGRMVSAALLEFTCILFWFCLLVWKLKGRVDISECDIDGCRGFIDKLNYFSLVTVIMAVLSALLYHNYDKKQRKEKQAGTQRSILVPLQQPPSELRRTDAAVTIIDEESLETRSRDHAAVSIHSRTGLIQEGAPLGMGSQSYNTSSTRSQASSIQEVTPLEMASPAYIINSATRSQLSVAEPSGLLSPNYTASSSRPQAGQHGVPSPTPVANIPQEGGGPTARD